MGIFNNIKSAIGYGVKKTTESASDGVRFLIHAAKETDKFLTGASKGFEEGMIKPTAELLFGKETEDRSAQFVPKSKAELLGQTLTYPSKYLSPELIRLGVPGPISFAAGLLADVAVPGPEVGLAGRTGGKVAKELDPLLSSARGKTLEEFLKEQEQIPFAQSFSMTNKVTRGGAASFQPSKTSVFHGTDPLNIEKIISSGELSPRVSSFDQARENVVSMSRNRNIAETQGGQIVFEIKNSKVKARPAPEGVIKGEGKVDGFEVRSDTPIKLSDVDTAYIHIKKGETLDSPIKGVRQIDRFGNTELYIKDTYGGVKNKLEAAGIKTVVLDENLTKSQLTSIWELAQKGITSGEVGTGVRTAEKAMTGSAQQLLDQVPKSIAQRTAQQIGGGGSFPPSIPPSGKKSIGDLMEGAVDRLSVAIRESAKPAREKLEEVFTAERSRRAGAVAGIFDQGGGQKGYYQALSKLKGELSTSAQKSFDKIKLIEEDIQTLFKMAQSNPALDVYEKLNTQTALTKILGGIIPNNSELALLNKTYGDNLVKIIIDKKTTGQKILGGLAELVNLPRSIMSTFDLSAPFRQGLALISHPKAFFNAFMGMFKQFGSEVAFKAVQESIAAMPEYALMKQGKLALADLGVTLGGREERFLSSWAEVIPGVRASSRAYTGFLNKLRADVFTEIVQGVRAGGRKLDTQLVEAIADFVNVASGRGSKLFGHVSVGGSSILNGLFFSPRLMASRTTLMNPIKYVTADPVIRKEMLKSLFSVLGAGMTMMGVAKMSGAKVGDTPTSSDFGKIVIGNTRVDPWGGFQQYVRMAAQLWTGKYTSSVTGKELTLGEGYKPLTRFDILWRQIEAKEAPIASFITDLLRQNDYKGDPISVPKEIADRFKPLMVSGLYDIYKDDPTLLPLGLLSVFGVGLQTYSQTNPTFKSKLKSPAKVKEVRVNIEPFKSKLK